MILEKYKELNLSKNKKSLILLNLTALVLLVLGFWLFAYLGAWIKQLPSHVTATFGMEEALVYSAGFIALLLIHEGIHALFFKVFAPDRPIKYGFHGYALSSSSPGTKYPKGQFIWIGLAPFVLITTFLSLGLWFNWLPFLGYVFLASFHTSGCVGDFYFTYLLLKEPSDIFVEDIGTGMIFYRPKEVDGG